MNKIIKVEKITCEVCGSKYEVTWRQYPTRTLRVWFHCNVCGKQLIDGLATTNIDYDEPKVVHTGELWA